MDGHFSNSIEDCRAFALDLEEAIPRWATLNPMGSHGDDLAELRRRLVEVVSHRRLCPLPRRGGFTCELQSCDPT